MNHAFQSPSDLPHSSPGEGSRGSRDGGYKFGRGVEQLVPYFWPSRTFIDTTFGISERMRRTLCRQVD